jgi:AsmA protein
VQDPKVRDSDGRLTIGSVQADIPLRSVWSGRPQVSELVVTKPVLYVPLRRERDPRIDNSPRPATTSGDTAANDFSIDHVKITDGAVAFTNLRDRVDNRIDGINADAVIGADRQVTVGGNARSGEQPLKFDIKAVLPAGSMQRQNIPVELTLDSPGLVERSLSAKAQVRANGAVLAISGLSGTLDGVQFNGWASADLSSKPLVKVDLDFQRFQLGTPSGGKPPSQPGKPWSNEPINLAGLNYVDAQVRISAAELNIGDARFAPAAVDAALGGGVLKAAFSHLGVYGGEADGELTVDVSGNNPDYILRSDLAGVRALPLLSGLADFDKIDGKMQAKLAFRSSGTSQRAIISNLSGTAFMVFQDGAIRDLNVARMIRSLILGTLSGWQERKDQVTGLTQLGASFRIEQGQATTTDLTLIGPLVRMTGSGTVDLPAKTLAFRVEPKLVMSIEGQGSAANPVGLGIPVVIEGPWAEPRIYPEMAGMLDNPDAAYAKLKEMGKGLFGQGGTGGQPGQGSGMSDQLGGKLGETLGTLLQQGLGSRGAAPVAPAPPQDQLKPPPDQESPMDGIMKQLFGR